MMSSGGGYIDGPWVGYVPNEIAETKLRHARPVPQLVKYLLEMADDTERGLWKRLCKHPGDVAARGALVDYLLERNRPTAAALVRKKHLP